VIFVGDVSAAIARGLSTVEAPGLNASRTGFSMEPTTYSVKDDDALFVIGLVATARGGFLLCHFVPGGHLVVVDAASLRDAERVHCASSCEQSAGPRTTRPISLNFCPLPTASSSTQDARSPPRVEREAYELETCPVVHSTIVPFQSHSVRLAARSASERLTDLPLVALAAMAAEAYAFADRVRVGREARPDPGDSACPSSSSESQHAEK